MQLVNKWWNFILHDIMDAKSAYGFKRINLQKITVLMAVKHQDNPIILEVWAAGDSRIVLRKYQQVLALFQQSSLSHPLLVTLCDIWWDPTETVLNSGIKHVICIKYNIICITGQEQCAGFSRKTEESLFSSLSLSGSRHEGLQGIQKMSSRRVSFVTTA